MSIILTYFVHGTTLDNERDIASGWSDVDLSELGIRQSMELKPTIADKRFDLIISSDLKRAAHSAQLMFAEGTKISLDARLRECNYGDHNGQPTSIVDPMQRHCLTTPFPNGESYEQVKERMQTLLDWLRAEHDGTSVALIAHKAPQLALEVLLHHKTWEEALDTDWRLTKSWQPGWKYILG